MKTAAMGILLLTVLSFGIWLRTFKYHECKKVGHSTLYCVFD